GADRAAAAARMVLRGPAQAGDEAPGLACRNLFSRLGGLGGELVAGPPTGAGHRRDSTGDAVCGVGGQRGLSRLCHSRGLGRVARPHQTCLATRMVAPAAPRAASDSPALEGHCAGGSGLVCSLAVSADCQAGLAPVCAHQYGRDLSACRHALLSPLAALCAPARDTVAWPGHSLSASGAATGVYPVGLVGGRL